MDSDSFVYPIESMVITHLLLLLLALILARINPVQKPREKVDILMSKTMIKIILLPV
jgi:hypothetical protein